MLEKIGNLAENVAAGVGVSRRGFLGWAGRGALAVAGVLAAASIAKAGAKAPKKNCCTTGGCPYGYRCSGPPYCYCRPVGI